MFMGGEGVRAEASEQQNSSKEIALKAKGRILLGEAHTWSLLKHLYPRGIPLTTPTLGSLSFATSMRLIASTRGLWRLVLNTQLLMETRTTRSLCW